MRETFFEKWRHRFRDTWLVFTGQAWIGFGNPSHWQYIGPLRMTEDELLKGLDDLIHPENAR
jgi:hypothetical protein